MLDVRPFSIRDKRFRQLVNRIRPETAPLEAEADEIIQTARKGGLEALLDDAGRREGVAVDPAALRVREEEIADARGMVSEHFLTALSLARVNLRKFHEYQRRRGYVHDDGDGVRLSRLVRPLGRVGICCADFGGLLSCAVPALVAGVDSIAVAARPREDGGVCPKLLAAARILGIDEVYRLGGAHGIAAMALGLDPIRRVDKIVGYDGLLAEKAKRLLSEEAGAVCGAAESELVVVADDTANARFIASDLLGQAFRDDPGVVALFTTDRLLAEAVRIEMGRMAEDAPDPDALALAMERSGGLFVCSGLAEAIEAANLVAPARLELMTRDDAEWVAEVENAGAVFLGPWASGASGEYFAGASSLYPSSGLARFASGLGVEDFVKEITVVECGPDRLMKTGRHLMTLASDAGDKAGADAIQERLELLRLVSE